MGTGKISNEQFRHSVQCMERSCMVTVRMIRRGPMEKLAETDYINGVIGLIEGMELEKENSNMI